ncbi:hypothetical protein [Nonomuraea rhizosphaerae]|uniref:hypothetical protein n=1 Tax=Nonomuraea rhizosphaerae TaxID=2665663 RepID=UPI001C5E40CB|nr:hypothetical protein [Nonomuraea rhizosphaerae]
MRWSDASTITLLTGQPELPDAWWRSLPMPHVLAAIGPESLGELLTEITLEHWPAAAVGDVLPALHVLDPEEADEPQVAIALDRAGSWTGLLGLTARELVDQPFIQARPVLNTLFSAVLVRLAPQLAEERSHAAPMVEQAPSPGEEAPVVGDVLDAEEPDAEVAKAEAAGGESPEADAAGGESPEPADSAEQAEQAEQAGPVLDADAEPVVDAEPIAEPIAEFDSGPGAEEEREPVLDAAEEPAPEPAAQEADEAAGLRAEGLEDEPEAAQAPEEAPEGHAPDEEAAPDDRPAADEEPALDEASALEADAAPEEAEPVSEHAEPVSGESADQPEDAAPEEPAALASEAAVPEAAALEADALEAPGLETPEPAGPEPAASEPEASGPEPEPEAEHAPGPSQELPDLIEAAFAGLDDKSWAVAQNRVFTDQPSAVDQLAKLFAVPPAEIDATENELRTRLDQWLSSDEAAPYRAHLDELRRTIGTTAPKERLIGAADWHAVEIRALEVPAWQFVLATLPDRPPAQEPQPVQHAFQPQPQAQEPVELPSAFAQVPQIPSPPPGTPQFQAFTPAEPVVAGEGNGKSGEQHKPYQPLKDVSQTRRCFRQPDGRWWLRIDVTAEQLTGGECALPTGFATYLGLSPGESRTVRSAAGELTMTWHGRPVLESVERLLADVGAKEGGHLFLTLSDEGVLRARHLPVAAQGAEKITKALRLVGYTAPGGTREQAARVIATRIGMTGPVGLPDLLTRLRERGDRDLLQLLD